jgi:hypothetical protein
MLEDQNIAVINSGWPDFLCITPSNKIFVVEVKRDRMDKLSGMQGLVMSSLSEAGIPSFISYEGILMDYRSGVNTREFPKVIDILEVSKRSGRHGMSFDALLKDEVSFDAMRKDLGL